MHFVFQYHVTEIRNVISYAHIKLSNVEKMIFEYQIMISKVNKESIEMFNQNFLLCLNINLIFQEGFDIAI